MKKRKGFSLVELMVVVAIMAVLAAIAVPNLLKSRQVANEQAAQSALQTISSALETYFTTFMTYPTLYSELMATNPAFINTDYCDGQEHSGYLFFCDGSDGNGFSGMAVDDYDICAEPAAAASGARCYQVSQGGILSTIACP
ncbi:type IV pilin protein [Candidatus Omnitrophota bacterium]